MLLDCGRDRFSLIIVIKLFALCCFEVLEVLEEVSLRLGLNKRYLCIPAVQTKLQLWQSLLHKLPLHLQRSQIAQKTRFLCLSLGIKLKLRFTIELFSREVLECEGVFTQFD